MHLLKRFNVTDGGFKQKFKTARTETGEAPTQFIARLESYLMRQIDLANVPKDFDGLMNLIVMEQYLQSCPVHTHTQPFYSPLGFCPGLSA